MDNVTLHLGDCLEYMRTLPDGCVDAVVTDPPYGINGGKGGDSRDFGKGNYSGAFPDTEEYIGDVVIPVIRHLIANVSAVAVTPGNRCMHLYPKATDIGCFWTPATVTHGPWGFTTFQPILYYGKDWRAGRGALPSGKQVTERAEKNGHPCPKPLGAWSWLVDKVARPGSTVFDPFMGSGTTGVACVQTGRRFLGCELDAGYFAIAQRRIEQAQPALVV
jgi:DNA modification methylase